MKFIKPDRLWLRDHATLNEKWVQERIADDPKILGLGDLILKDKERMQPRAGRLDLLLQHQETDRRYEVEVQLGSTNESHIIRTLEYWDIERKRFPQYDHCAVLVAEDITSRFLNVIGLFNSSVPFVAVQMTALAFDDQVALVFTTVLDEMSRGLEEEDHDEQEPTDRDYWETRSTKDALAMADKLLEVIRRFDPKLEPKYNKFYIGLARDGAPDNFVIFKPQKNILRVELRLTRSDEIDQQVDSTGLDLMPYGWGRYRIRLTKGDAQKHEELLTSLLKRAYDARSS